MRFQYFVGVGGAVCAILAGVARAVLIIVHDTNLNPPMLETLYLAIDLGILLAVLALALRLGKQLGLWGLAGIVIAFAGLIIIRTGDRSLFGAAAYTSGASLLAIGMAVTTVPLLRSRGLARITAALFLLSPVTAIVGAVLSMRAAAFVIGSACFSSAWITAGALLMLKGHSTDGETS